MYFRMYQATFVVLFYICILEIRGDCPPPNFIKPCVCLPLWKPPAIQCSNITNVDILRKVFNQSFDRPFGHLYIRDSSMPYVPASSLVSKYIEKLSIVNSSLQSIFDRPPDSQNLLTHMYLDHLVLLRGVQWQDLRTLGKLKNFSARQVVIKKLGEKFRDNISRSTEVISISSTKTQSIIDDAFQNLNNLSTVDFEFTDISILKRSMFPNPSHKLFWIAFRASKIATLPSDLFDHMPLLGMVDFSGNRLTTLSRAVFENVFRRSTLYGMYMHENPFVCDCKMRWIVERIRKRRVEIVGKCQNPPDRVGRDLMKLKVEDFKYCHNTTTTVN